MSDNTLVCTTCKKQYKKPGAFIKHQKECIKKRIDEKNDTTNEEFISEMEYHKKHSEEEEEPEVEGISLPSVSGVSEEVTLTTGAVEDLLNKFLTQVFDFQHRQTQQLVNQNIQLIHENKILATTVRSIVASKPEMMNDFVNEHSVDPRR